MSKQPPLAPTASAVGPCTARAEYPSPYITRINSTPPAVEVYYPVPSHYTTTLDSLNRTARKMDFRHFAFLKEERLGSRDHKGLYHMLLQATY